MLLVPRTRRDTRQPKSQQKDTQQCGRKGRPIPRAREPKCERQRARRRELWWERARGREEEGKPQFLGIFTTSSWRSDIFFPSFPFRDRPGPRRRSRREGVIARSVRYYSLSNTQPCRNRCTTWSRNLCEAFKWRRPYPYRDPRTPRAQ